MPRIPAKLTLALLTAAASTGCATPSGSPEYMNLPGRTDSLPYSHAVLDGRTLYVAGTLGIDPETGTIPEDVEREIRLALDGIQAKLELADMTMDDLVWVQVFCSDRTLYETFNGIYRTYFDDRFPARAFVGSGALLRDARFEINGIAVRSD